jgi:GNAT superfamily N-acetyltransferase
MQRVPVRVRRAVARDAAPLSALYREIRQWLLDQGNWQWRDERFSATAMRRDISRAPVLVAIHQGHIVGAVGVAWQDRQFWPELVGSDGLYVRRLVIARRVARRGVAGGLLAAAASIARSRRRWRLRLDCAPLPPLERAYRRLGFTLVDESDLGGYRVLRFERPSGVGQRFAQPIVRR